MLKDLILKYGKEKINTLTKYPSILNLLRLGDKGKLQNELFTIVECQKKKELIRNRKTESEFPVSKEITVIYNNFLEKEF